MKHTKTPISLMDTHLQLSKDTIAYGVVDRENGIVFTICAPIDNKAIQHNAAEAAEEIVRCVNSHDALVAALQACMSRLGEVSLGIRPSMSEIIVVVNKAQEALEAAGETV